MLHLIHCTPIHLTEPVHCYTVSKMSPPDYLLGLRSNNHSSYSMFTLPPILSPYILLVSPHQVIILTPVSDNTYPPPTLNPAAQHASSQTEAISHLHLLLLDSTLPTLCASLTGSSCGLIGHLFVPSLPVGEIWEICRYVCCCDMMNWAWRKRYEKMDESLGAWGRFHYPD